MSDITTAIVQELPDCDYCKMEDVKESAEYDGRTKIGPWAFMCQQHFDLNGVGLGLGRGQKLILRGSAKQPDELISKADKLCKSCGKDCDENSWNKETGRYRVLDQPDKIQVMIMLGLYCEEI